MVKREELNQIIRLTMAALPLMGVIYNIVSAVYVIGIMFLVFVATFFFFEVAKRIWRSSYWSFVVFFFMACFVQMLILLLGHQAFSFCDDLVPRFSLLLISGFLFVHSTLMRQTEFRAFGMSLGGYAVLVMVIGLAKTGSGYGAGFPAATFWLIACAFSIFCLFRSKRRQN